MLNDKSEKLRLEEICIAAFEGKVDVLQNLLENNIDLNNVGKNWSPLHSAIENLNIECVRLLLQKGANVEYCGEGCRLTPLEHAIDISVQSNNNTGGKDGEESIEIICILLEAGADPRSGLQIANLYQANKILTILKNYIVKNER
ncbi:ankyrin repeat domain-containing protein [Cytophaga aurantiaca]|uniref:ankyrin repeat domain-containing protein n=1 Tax=Cytophaga aurantiaca TaxID=29530 RepID=UPI00036ADB91|nr:ankyrin repeat domain-containing protein [Cytophaga aurantiaca]